MKVRHAAAIIFALACSHGLSADRLEVIAGGGDVPQAGIEVRIGDTPVKVESIRKPSGRHRLVLFIDDASSPDYSKTQETWAYSVAARVDRNAHETELWVARWSDGLTVQRHDGGGERTAAPSPRALTFSRGRGIEASTQLFLPRQVDAVVVLDNALKKKVDPVAVAREISMLEQKRLYEQLQTLRGVVQIFAADGAPVSLLIVSHRVTESPAADVAAYMKARYPRGTFEEPASAEVAVDEFIQHCAAAGVPVYVWTPMQPAERMLARHRAMTVAFAETDRGAAETAVKLADQTGGRRERTLEEVVEAIRSDQQHRFRIEYDGSAVPTDIPRVVSVTARPPVRHARQTIRISEDARAAEQVVGNLFLDYEPAQPLDVRVKPHDDRKRSVIVKMAPMVAGSSVRIAARNSSGRIAGVLHAIVESDEFEASLLMPPDVYTISVVVVEDGHRMTARRGAVVVK